MVLWQCACLCARARGEGGDLARESRITGVADAFVVGKVAPVSGLLRSSACAARVSAGLMARGGLPEKPRGLSWLHMEEERVAPRERAQHRALSHRP